MQTKDHQDKQSPEVVIIIIILPWPITIPETTSQNTNKHHKCDKMFLKFKIYISNEPQKFKTKQN